jgi:sulfite exporter TauE/SafE/copper chaperone CopZ
MARSKTTSPPTTVTVPIQGMTCAACETRLNRTLKKLPHVTSVKASTRLAQATITSDRPVDPAAIERLIVKAGYKVGRAKRPWLTNERVVWRDCLVTVAVIVFVYLAARAAGLGSIGEVIGGRTDSSLALFALLGVAASLSTCMALVGGVVLGLSARFAETHPDATSAQRVRPQVMFNLGRVVGFTALGAVLGAVGEALSLSGAGLGALMLAVAVVMGLLGAKLTGLSPRLAAATWTLPAGFANLIHRDGDTARPYRDSTALALGALSFFLPCGFTQAAQVAAAASGSPLTGALILGLFTLGTTPGLMAVGTLSSFVQGRWAATAFRAMGVLVLAFAVSNLGNAVQLIAPAAFQDSAPVTATARTDNVTDEDGFQVVRIQVDARGYTPQQTVVYAGQPIRWEFTLNGLTCASTVDGRNFNLGGNLPLQQGLNVYESTLASPGRYPYSCYMGMFRSSVVAI